MDENEVVVLKKKFFFSDQNIDRNDPIQLNLLYVQVRKEKKKRKKKTPASFCPVDPKLKFIFPF